MNGTRYDGKRYKPARRYKRGGPSHILALCRCTLPDPSGDPCTCPWRALGGVHAAECGFYRVPGNGPPPSNAPSVRVFLDRLN